MPRYGDRDRDRHSSSTRLYVGHLSSRTRTYDLEDVFSRYGRFLGFCLAWWSMEFSDPRDAEDARHALDGRDVDGSRIIVEFARGGPRGPGGSRDARDSRDFGRGPPPGAGRCFNCGIDGHWARECKAGDWKNKCYRCGERGHIERNCQNSPKKIRRGRSYSRSVSPRRRSPSPRRGRSKSPSFSRSRSYSRSRSPVKRDRAVERVDRSRSPRQSRSPKRQRGSPLSSRGRKHSPSPDEREPRGRASLSPADGRQANGSDYGGSPRARSRSPMDDEPEKVSPRNGDARSPYEENGRDQSASPDARNGNGREDDDDYQGSPRGSE